MPLRFSLLVIFTAALLLWGPGVRPSAAAPLLSIVITGVSGEAEENVEAALALPPGLVREGEVDRRWLERFRRQIPDKVRTALEPFGFYNPEVIVTVQDLAGGAQRLLVDVSPGEPVRLRKVHVEVRGGGETPLPLREVVEAFPLGEGDVLRHDLYEETKGALRARALDLGYLDADFSRHEIRVSRGEGWAEIDLVLDTGPRYRFGEVRIEGGEQYPQDYLRRFLAFHPEDDFSYARLGQTQLNFLDSERFREVFVSPRQEEAEDNLVPITVQLTPAPTRRLRPGIGYATDTGPRFTLRYRDLNVRSRGHELNGEFLLAELKQSFGIGYIVPSRRNIESHIAYRVGYDHEDLDIYERQTLFAEAERVRVYAAGWRRSYFLRVQQEDFTIGEVDSTSRLVLPGARLSRRRYPDVVRPQQGYSFSVEGRGTHEALGSDTALLQVLASGSALFPLPGRFSLFLRAQTGYTVQNDPLSEIPPSLRFFAGGDQSVRGYAYQSLGPTDGSGRVVGGKNLLVGSIELERAIRANWGLALFYDAGNAFNSFGNYTLRHGAGAGVRWYTPVGPIRLDLARQIAIEDPSFRVHLSIGFGW